MTTNTQKHPPQSESLHIRVRPKTLEDIDQIAEHIGRSRNWVMNKALEQYLDLQKWQMDLVEKRLEESERPDAEFIPHAVVMKRQKKRLQKKLGL